MIKVIHVLSSVGNGGVESMLYNYYIYMNKELIKFDFIVHDHNIGIIGEKLLDLGCNIYFVTPKKKSFNKNTKEMKKIIKQGNYDIVHCHQNLSSFSTMYIAKKLDVPIRIVHAHGNKKHEIDLKDLTNPIRRFLNIRFANYFFACSIEAGKWLYGKKWSINGRNIIINNAIDLSKFKYDQNIRNKYRKDFRIREKKVLIHIGRFSTEKNHLFLLRMMRDLIKVDNDYILFLIGDGSLKYEVEKFVEENRLISNVVLLGSRDDIPQLLNMADILLLPSHYEGLGMTLIEGQATGLKVIASNNIPKITKLTDNIVFLPIDDHRVWIDEILKLSFEKRGSQHSALENAGFSIAKEAIIFQKLLERLYLNGN